MRIEYFDSFEGPNQFAFLSNFYESRFSLLGHVFKTGEHAFQAYKAKSIVEFNRVKRMPTPGEAKGYGRRMPLRSDWEIVKYDVMRVVLWAKFQRETEMAWDLMATGQALLVEGNTWNDQVWGVRKDTGQGRNWLGTLLMVRRAELVSGEEPDMLHTLRYIQKGMNSA